MTLPTDEITDLLCGTLSAALLHEDESEFITQSLAELENLQDLGGIGLETVGKQTIFLKTIFSALPRSETKFVFTDTIKPNRNDLCFCGSGKKYKKCCATLDIKPTPPAELVFQMALSGLTHQQAEMLAQKPNWSVKALGVFIAWLEHKTLWQPIIDLFDQYLADTSRLRNEHREILSSVLDAMFELRRDKKRITLMNDLTRHSKANSLQSLGYMRLAMIAAQDGEAIKARQLLQSSMRADPKHEEFPMAEMSVLGFIEDEQTLISRARYWLARLQKHYEDDYPPIELMKTIISEGKSFFETHQTEGAPQVEFDDCSELNLSNLIGAFAKSEEHTPQLYQLKTKNQEAQLQLLPQFKKPVKHWVTQYQSLLNECEDDVCLNDFPAWMDYETALRIELWHQDEYEYEENGGWVKAFWDNPDLLHSLDILVILDQLASSAIFLNIEDDAGITEDTDVDDDEEHSSLDETLLYFVSDRQRLLLANIISNLQKNNLTLPARFKANKSFWQIAHNIYLKLKNYDDTGQARIEFLTKLTQVDPDFHGWLPESLAGELFAKQQYQQLSEFLEQRRKITPVTMILKACCEHQQGADAAALKSLKRLNLRYRKQLTLLRDSLISDNIDPLMNNNSSFTQVFFIIKDTPEREHQRWLITHLPG